MVIINDFTVILCIINDNVDENNFDVSGILNIKSSYRATNISDWTIKRYRNLCYMVVTAFTNIVNDSTWYEIGTIENKDTRYPNANLTSKTNCYFNMSSSFSNTTHVYSLYLLAHTTTVKIMKFGKISYSGEERIYGTLVYAAYQ